VSEHEVHRDDRENEKGLAISVHRWNGCDKRGDVPCCHWPSMRVRFQCLKRRSPAGCLSRYKKELRTRLRRKRQCEGALHSSGVG